MSLGKKRNPMDIFVGVKFVIGEHYCDKKRAMMKASIESGGGKVTSVVSKSVNFLIQGWLDEPCDDRLEKCCKLGIFGVPIAYIESCVENNTMIPFRLWAMEGSGSFSLCLNLSNLQSLRSSPAKISLCETPVFEAENNVRSCILGAMEFGNMDLRCKETEELNQSVHEYIAQNWPALVDTDRSIIYLQPIVTKVSKAKVSRTKQGSNNNTETFFGFPGHEPTNEGLLSSSKMFLESYFGATVKVLDPVVLILEKRKGKNKVTASACGVSVRVCESSVDGIHTTLFDVLDLLNVMDVCLPEDAYCVLGLTDEYLYEWSADEDDSDFDNSIPPEDDDCLSGLMRGRAFGGSRIAVFSTACYGRYMQSPLCTGPLQAAEQFAYHLSNLAHETMHCFGLDHCGIYQCCMNSWCDEIKEFSLVPNAKHSLLRCTSDSVVGCLHVCPICVRKLQVTCKFDMRERYITLEDVYRKLGLEDQARWCKAVLRVAAAEIS